MDCGLGQLLASQRVDQDPQAVVLYLVIRLSPRVTCKSQQDFVGQGGQGI